MASGGRTSFQFLIGCNVTGTQQVTKLGNSMQGVQGKAKNLALSMKGLATGLAAVAGAAASFRAISQSLEVFSDRQADALSLTLGLTRLTNEAPKTARALTKVADALGYETLFDESDFQKGFVLLTTFKDIAVSNYRAIAEAAADMAQATPTVSVQSAFMQLAKAMGDPARGLTALRRSGVIFTEQQTQMVKSLVKANKHFEAQQLILKAVQASYNNLSKIAAKGLAGSFDTLGQRLRDFQYELGKLLTPFAQPLIDGLAGGIAKMTEAIKAVIKFMPILIDKMRILLKITAAYAAVWLSMTAMKALGAILKAARILLSIDKARLALTKARAVLEAAMASKNIWGALALGGAAFAVINKAIDSAVDSTKELYEELEKTIDAIGGGKGKKGEKGGGLLGGIKDGMTKYMDSIKTLAEGVSDIVQKTFKGLEDALVNFVKTGKLNFANLVDSILTDIARLTIQKTITGPLSTILSNALTGAIGGSLSNAATQSATTAVTSNTSGVANQLQQQFGDGGYGTSGGTGMMYGRALGGSVVSGASYLVGEQGPEMFTPTGDGTITSNHDLVMDRYRPTGSASTAGTSAEEGGSFSTGGGAVIDVNYHVESINSVDYVTVAQFQQGMSQAAKEGAKQGEQATLHKLQNSSSTRRRVGV